MANISQIRGALLEEAILFLLEKVGYETIEADPLNPSEDLRGGHSGLDVKGRGTWHQIDALASFMASPAFMYPLRLMVEAKCYQEHRTVGIEVARNSVGVLKDISENYFSVSNNINTDVQMPRYNYHSAIFSTSGFTSGAVSYAIAHQIFLIQYEHVPVIQPLIDAIMSFDEECVTENGKRAVTEVRKRYRRALRDRLYEIDTIRYLTPQGLELVEHSMVEALNRIGGSYFGMLQGRWPLHLLTTAPLPVTAFEQDVVQCRVTGSETGEWKFTPSEFRPNEDGWFELQFNLPGDIAKLVSGSFDDPNAIANLKQRHFSYINLSGVIGGIRRSVKLELDRDWIAGYLQRINRRRT